MPALLGFVGAVLAVLLVVPLWLDARIDEIRTQIEAEVDLTAAQSAELERQLAFAAASSRGFLISGDSLFAEDFRESERAATDALGRLAASAPTLGSEVPGAVARVQEAWETWRTSPRRLPRAAEDRAAAAAALTLSQARYETLIGAAAALDDAVRTAGVVREEQVRALERAQRWMLAVLIPLALLAAGVVAWLGRRLHIQTETLTARGADLRALAADLERRIEARTREVRRLSVAIVETERREQARIAQLLHDHLQQLLYGARMRLGSLAVDPDDEDRKAVDGILADAIQATRTLAVELAPPVLREAGLPAALGWLGRHVERVHGLRVTVEADGAAATAPRHVQDLLFQLARELLFNVAKHAGVDEARLTLCSDEGRLRLVVADAGAGFDPVATPDGYGLGSVRERVALVEGTLDVASCRGAGTTVTVEVPLQSPGA